MNQGSTWLWCGVVDVLLDDLVGAVVKLHGEVRKLRSGDG